MQASSPQSKIVWRQVWGLSALLAAISFSWMAYGLYQPQLLNQLGFINLAAWLGVIQGCLGAVIEPLVGAASDRVIWRWGSRLPQITTGVTLAGLIFVSVALLIQVNLQGQVRWLVPILMTVWVIAMIIFRGPVIALLQQSAPLAALPQANLVLTVVFGLVGALEPLLSNLFQRLGGSITFMLGAIALVIGAAILYALAPPRQLFSVQVQQPLPIQVSVLAKIFAVGFGTGLAQNLLLRILPMRLATGSTGFSAPLITSGVLLISALSVVPLEPILKKLGLSPSLLGGVAGVTLCTGLVLFSPHGVWAVGLILLAGVAFGIIFTGQIPYALITGPAQRAGLSTGILLSGVGSATALVSALLQSTQAVTAIMALVWAVVALLVAGWGMGLSQKGLLNP